MGWLTSLWGPWRLTSFWLQLLWAAVERRLLAGGQCTLVQRRVRVCPATQDNLKPSENLILRDNFNAFECFQNYHAISWLSKNPCACAITVMLLHMNNMLFVILKCSVTSKKVKSFSRFKMLNFSPSAAVSRHRQRVWTSNFVHGKNGFNVFPNWKWKCCDFGVFTVSCSNPLDRKPMSQSKPTSPLPTHLACLALIEGGTNMVLLKVCGLPM